MCIKVFFEKKVYNIFYLEISINWKYPHCYSHVRVFYKKSQFQHESYFLRTHITSILILNKFTLSQKIPQKTKHSYLHSIHQTLSYLYIKHNLITFKFSYFHPLKFKLFFNKKVLIIFWFNIVNFFLLIKLFCLLFIYLNTSIWTQYKLLYSIFSIGIYRLNIWLFIFINYYYYL